MEARKLIYLYGLYNLCSKQNASSYRHVKATQAKFDNLSYKTHGPLGGHVGMSSQPRLWSYLLHLSLIFKCLMPISRNAQSAYTCWCYYIIIDFNEVDIRIYLPEKVKIIEAARSR